MISFIKDIKKNIVNLLIKADSRIVLESSFFVKRDIKIIYLFFNGST